MTKLLRVPLDALAAGRVTLADAAATYVARVHRLEAGDAFVGFDPAAGREADALVLEATRERVVVELGPARPASVLPSRRVTLVQAVAKGDKMDAIVRDATELGATRIVPVIAERSVARPDAARAERWRRIAIEASRQSGRGDTPRIDVPTQLAAALRLDDDGGVRVLLDPTGESSLGAALGDVGGRAITIFVGPEGGWSGPELAIAAAAPGLRVASLGAIVLRTETVCAAVLGALLVLAPA